MLPHSSGPGVFAVNEVRLPEDANAWLGLSSLNLLPATGKVPSASNLAVEAAISERSEPGDSWTRLFHCVQDQTGVPRRS